MTWLGWKAINTAALIPEITCVANKISSELVTTLKCSTELNAMIGLIFFAIRIFKNYIIIPCHYIDQYYETFLSPPFPWLNSAFHLESPINLQT